MRDYLKEKTFIRFPGGECYEILGMIGEGGSGLIYSAGKVVRQQCGQPNVNLRQVPAQVNE